MKTTDIIKKSVLEGFSYADISTTKIVVTLLLAYLIAIYIHLVYKYVTKNSFYYKNYGIAMTVMSVITAGIILAMQSSLVISLGMVGALSIVRFRTAIKDPLDLLFLFWSIGSGIICGAGLYELAIIMSLIATIGIMLFDLLPIRKHVYLLIVNGNNELNEKNVFEDIKTQTRRYKLKSRNINDGTRNYIWEIEADQDKVESILIGIEKIRGVESVSLLEKNTEI